MKLFFNVVSIDFEKLKDVYIYVYLCGFFEYLIYNFSSIVIKIVIINCFLFFKKENFYFIRVMIFFI